VEAGLQYHAYELAHAWVSPVRAASQGLKFALDMPFNPMGKTLWGRKTSSVCEMFEELTRRYCKPEFGIKDVQIEDKTVPVTENVVLSKGFSDLLHFTRDVARDDPKVLLVAPMSGHYATLLRGTVRDMLPEHDVYITDWRDARSVPVSAGAFGMDDYVDYITEFIQLLGPSTHVIAVCQSAVPTLVATARLAMADDPCQPASLTLMGGPIDTRINPTVVNTHVDSKDMAWFERMLISTVPYSHPGFLRKVYPGFIQLNGFLAMNLDKHIDAHHRQFENMVVGDEDPIVAHKAFYEEYLSVMDLPAEFFLETVKIVFKDHALPKGEMTHRGVSVDFKAIQKTILMTVEGENDDICAVGQTQAAHAICVNVPDAMRRHYVQPQVGHYGVFNGQRWRSVIQPRIRNMIRGV
jgi:poly(3-hydroxybutyrate) depolymerase